jgi:hypothetical protein
MREGVDAEKWSEALEAQYRAQGDTRRANAIRSCRQYGGQACGIVLTNREMWSLYSLAQESAGDEAKVQAGLAAAVPSLVPLIGPTPPVFISPVPIPPVGTPPPTFIPPVPIPPVGTPPPMLAPGAGAGAGAGLGIGGAVTVAGIAAIVAVCVIAGIQLWQLSKFQEELGRRGLIILHDPLAICIRGCHLPSRPPVREIPLPRRDPFDKRTLEEIRKWLEREKGPQPTPQPTPRPDEEEQQRKCQEMHPSALLCSGFSDRDEAVVEFLMNQGYSYEDFDCEGFSSHPEGTISACDFAPGETWHCRIKGGGIVSIFACLCCNRDGSTGWEWRGAHWSTAS